MQSQLQNLTKAMPAFSPPAAGQTSLPANELTALQPMLAADWTA
jgi:hypothetical protein